jgi:hypothetical protein
MPKDIISKNRRKRLNRFFSFWCSQSYSGRTRDRS